MIEIINIVVTLKMCDSIDLPSFKQKALSDDEKLFGALIYKPHEFPGVRIFFPVKEANRERSRAALVFRSGKVVISGSKNLEEVEDVVNRLATMMERYGYEVISKDYKISNVVAQFDMKSKVNIDRLLAEWIQGNVDKDIVSLDYTQEIFPGATMRIKGLDLSFTIFSTGKVVVRGIACEPNESIEETYKRLEETYQILKEKIKPFFIS